MQTFAVTFSNPMHTYVGIDSLAMDCIASTAQLDAMREGFERGTLKPFPVARHFTLDEAMAESFLSGARRAYPSRFGGDMSRWRHTDVIRPEARRRVYWTIVSTIPSCGAPRRPIPSSDRSLSARLA